MTMTGDRSFPHGVTKEAGVRLHVRLKASNKGIATCHQEHKNVPKECWKNGKNSRKRMEKYRGQNDASSQTSYRMREHHLHPPLLSPQFRHGNLVLAPQTSMRVIPHLHLTHSLQNSSKQGQLDCSVVPLLPLTPAPYCHSNSQNRSQGKCI